MISKIIALVIAMLLLVASPVYGSIANPADPLEFGAGDGESKVVADAAELQTILSTIPNLNLYLENGDITAVDGFENFDSFTLVEDGYSKHSLSGNKRYVEIDGENQRVIVDTETTNSHVLEICFTKTGLYYHCIGEMETVKRNYNIETNGKYENRDGIALTERDSTFYDFEIYYSKDTVLVKYNDWNTVSAVSYSDEYYDAEWEYLELEDEQKAANDIVASSFGKWMKVDQNASEDDSLESLPNMDGMTEEEQAEAYREAMIDEFCLMYSVAQINSITQANESNLNYLRKLSAFIATNLTTNFTKKGDTYTLNNADTDDEDPDYSAETAFLMAVVGTTYGDKDPDAECKFNVNSDEIVLNQSCYLSNSSSVSGINDSMEIVSKTTFKNIGNTVASVSNINVKTVKDVLGAAVGDYVDEIFMDKEDN